MDSTYVYLIATLLRIRDVKMSNGDYDGLMARRKETLSNIHKFQYQRKHRQLS